jgi:hypothetical protein
VLMRGGWYYSSGDGGLTDGGQIKPCVLLINTDANGGAGGS